MSSTRVQKIMFQPISLIFRHLQNKSPILVWLYDRSDMRIQGTIVGFDEFMNLVLEDAVEIYLKTNERKPLGKIMLKGDNITLIAPCSVNDVEMA